jgi:hypothetical protein
LALAHHKRPVLQQQSHEREKAVSRGAMQRCFPIVLPCIGIGAPPEEKLCHLVKLVMNRYKERRGAFVVLHLKLVAFQQAAVDHV